MYGFLSEGVGQSSSFSTFQPIRPRFIPENIGVARVRVQTQNRILFEGPVPQTRLDVVLGFVRSARPSTPGVPKQYVAIGIGPRVIWSGNLTQNQIDQIITCLPDTGHCDFIAPPLYFDPYRRPRFAQSRSRGGAMTLFGLGAVGYALGGLPGAALGAAAALLKGKFDETRVG